MIAMLVFSGFSALLVFLAGRKDMARDPRFTAVVLAVLAGFPVLLALAPKAEVLPASSAVEGASFPWMSCLLAVWACGVLIMAIRLALAARVIAGWRRGSDLIGTDGRVEIRRVSSLRGPVAAGVFRPVVFVPAAWDSWSAETRRVVLAHELAHHRRRDPLWRWVAEIACLVNGGNPLVLWMSRRFALQCEFACDKRLLEEGIPAAGYARLLCDLAEDKPVRGPAMAMAARSSARVPGGAIAGSGEEAFRAGSFADGDADAGGRRGRYFRPPEVGRYRAAGGGRSEMVRQPFSRGGLGPGACGTGGLLVGLSTCGFRDFPMFWRAIPAV